MVTPTTAIDTTYAAQALLDRMPEDPPAGLEDIDTYHTIRAVATQNVQYKHALETLRGEDGEVSIFFSVHFGGQITHATGHLAGATPKEEHAFLHHLAKMCMGRAGWFPVPEDPRELLRHLGDGLQVLLLFEGGEILGYLDAVHHHTEADLPYSEAELAENPHLTWDWWVKDAPREKPRHSDLTETPAFYQVVDFQG